MIADLPILQRLSGLKQAAAVKRWLRANGVTFMVQPSGQPVTTMDAITRAMYGGQRQYEPDWSDPPSRQVRRRKADR